MQPLIVEDAAVAQYIISGVFAVLVALISSGVTYLATRQKSKVDASAAHLAGVNQATKTLIDAMFSQINLLHDEVERLREEHAEAFARATAAEAAHRTEQAAWAAARWDLEQEIARLRRLYDDQP